MFFWICMKKYIDLSLSFYFTCHFAKFCWFCFSDQCWVVDTALRSGQKRLASFSSLLNTRNSSCCKWHQLRLEWSRRRIEPQNCWINFNGSTFSFNNEIERFVLIFLNQFKTSYNCFGKSYCGQFSKSCGSPSALPIRDSKYLGFISYFKPPSKFRANKSWLYIEKTKKTQSKDVDYI